MTVVAAPQPSDTETARTLFLRGSFWTLLAYGGAQLLRLASSTILWRLLPEQAFGMMALVTAVMMGLHMFSEVGIGPSIVQNERGEDPSYLNTAWTIQAFRGVSLAVIAVLVAVPYARFYRQPELATLIMVVALTPLLDAFASTNLFTASRRLALRQVSTIELATQFAGTASTLLVAWITRSVVALAVSWGVSAALRLVLSHTALPGIRNRFQWDRTAVQALMHFGRWVFISTLLTFLAMNADRLVLGKVLDIKMMGVYSIAMVWATIPGQILGRMFGTVAFPVLSRAKNRGEPVGPVFLETRGKVLIAGAWATTGLIAGASPLIRVFYDERALVAIWMIPVLAMGGWFANLESSNSNAALALGQPKWLAAANGAKVAGMVVLVPIGGWLGGIPGAILGFALADVFKYTLSAVGATRLGVSAWRQDLLLMLGMAAVALATTAVRRLIGANHLPPLADAALVTVLVTGGWGLIWLVRRSWTRRNP
jgi:O-antigen/teichoic acid export membrane protein